MQNGELAASYDEIFHNSPVLTACQVKNQYYCTQLVYNYQGLYYCVPSFSWDVQRVEKRKNLLLHCLNSIFRYSPVGWVMINYMQRSF